MSRPPMKSVQSSNLSSIGHDGKDLFVTFKNGRTYRFFNVPQHEFDALGSSDSVGGHFNDFIRGQYSEQML